MYYYTEDDDLDFRIQLKVSQRKTEEEAKIKDLTKEIEQLKKQRSNLLNAERLRQKQHTKSAVTEAIKEFSEFLIGKSQNGIIFISDLPDYVIQMIKNRKSESEENNNA